MLVLHKNDYLPCEPVLAQWQASFNTNHDGTAMTPVAAVPIVAIDETQLRNMNVCI